MIKISVIMAVYNAEKFIAGAIESILSQSFSDFECIILDDGSTDISYQICQDYAKQDVRIRLYKNSQNEGISYTRNKLISLAESNYIAVQDSDDISVKKRLELSYNFLEKNIPFAAVSGNMYIINEESHVIGKREYSDDLSFVILKKSPIAQPAVMFRKDVFYEVGGYDRNLDYGEDYDLWLKIIRNGYKIKNLDTPLVNYRVHTLQSKTTHLKETLKNTLRIQKKAIREYNFLPTTTDRIYIFLEKCLLLLPNFLILWIFKKIEYKNEN